MSNTEGFIVSARKYRPARFADVIGQPQVTQTLKNAIRQNQVAQAFLFCGPRGVGKTTCARILAKVLNCENPTSDIEACNTCNSCLAFNQNASFNIHELDAASNNSVDDIRALVEQVRFAPQQGRWKIYIIDEVHMLSSAAFNAFLKTLEEPPAYAIFILATTEKHKIIPTILSRCQIFDFNRILLEDAANYLKDIAHKEHIEADDEALHLIAQKADGAMRDALSLFDRLSVFTNNRITYAAAVDNLNVLDYDYFFKVTDSFLAQDIGSILLTFDQIIRKGFEGENFLQGLAEHIRNLIVARKKETLVILDVTENLKQRYMAQSMYIPMPFLLNALNLLHEADARYKQSRNKRLLIELLLIKLCHLKEYINSGELQHTELKKKPDTIIPPSVSININDAQIKPIVKDDSIPTESVEINKSDETNTPAGKVAFQVRKRKSVSDILQEIKQETNTIEKEEEREITEDDIPPIEEDSFNECISALYSKLESEKQNGLLSALQANPPALINQKRIEIITGNASMHKILMGDKDTIASFIREYLKMKNIIFSLVFDKDTVQRETVAKPFTPEQRFEHLKKQNPIIEDLKNKLKLDIS